MDNAASKRRASEVQMPSRQPAPPAGPDDFGSSSPAPKRPPGDAAAIAAFFTLLYLGLWAWVDVGLIYHGGGEVRDFPVFYWGADFLRERLRVPGGATEYLAALAAQALFHGAAGALVLTGQAGLLFAAIRTALIAAGATAWRPLAFGPALLLVGLYGGYGHASNAVTALAAASLVFWGVVSLGQTRPAARLSLWLAGTCAVYGLAPSTLPFFVLSAAGLEALRRGGLIVCLAPAALGAFIVPIAGRWIYGFGLTESWATLLPFPLDRELFAERENLCLAGLHLFLPLLGLARALGVLASKRRREATADPAADGRSPRWRLALGIAAPSALLLLALGLGVDHRKQSAIAADYYAWQRQWPEVLRVAGAVPASPCAASAVVQANFHLHRLSHDLPPVRSPADLAVADPNPRGHWRKSDLAYDLGYVNMALHHLIEAVEFWGERPLLLRRLVEVNLALGNLPTARIYLKALAKVPFHSRWARSRLAQVAADPQSERDEEILRLRRLMPREDSIARQTPEETFTWLLAANRTNRMAFEYLMTFSLLTKNLESFARHLPRLDDFPGFEVTPLWEEAIALAAKTLDPRTHPVRRQLDPPAALRLQTLLETLQSCGGNLDRARSKLPPYYEQGYLYYFFFHR